MAKVRLHTRRHLHRATLRAAKERKTNTVDSGFMYRHTAEMRKMLRDVDLDRFERLADG